MGAAVELAGGSGGAGLLGEGEGVERVVRVDVQSGRGVGGAAEFAELSFDGGGTFGLLPGLGGGDGGLGGGGW